MSFLKELMLGRGTAFRRASSKGLSPTNRISNGISSPSLEGLFKFFSRISPSWCCLTNLSTSTFIRWFTDLSTRILSSSVFRRGLTLGRGPLLGCSIGLPNLSVSTSAKRPFPNTNSLSGLFSVPLPLLKLNNNYYFYYMYKVWLEEQYTTKEKHNKEIQVNYKRKINIIHSIYMLFISKRRGYCKGQSLSTQPGWKIEEETCYFAWVTFQWHSRLSSTLK